MASPKSTENSTCQAVTGDPPAARLGAIWAAPDLVSALVTGGATVVGVRRVSLLPQ